MRTALVKSMNISTVKVAESAGFDRVSDLAKRAGLGENILATPAVALGAYEVTPLDIAAAYNGLREWRASGWSRTSFDPSRTRKATFC